MYEDTILPVRNKVRIPSRTQARIYFVQDQTKKSLIFLKWLELAICLLCLGLTVAATHVLESPTTLSKIVTVTANLIGTLLALAQIIYPRFKRSLSLLLQVLEAGTSVAIYGVATIVIYQINNNGQQLVKIMLLAHALATMLFLTDVICKFIISTYLYQTTKVKSVADVGVSAFFPSPSPAPGRPKLHRSTLTATPITYGGTFPIGKDQTPFLPEERLMLVSDEHTVAEKGSRNRSVQTTHHGDSKAVGASTFNFGPSSLERLIARSQIVQTYLDQEDKGQSAQPPFYLTQDRIKKSPWTCSSPSTSRKIEARKLTCMSTPITYSGTFAVNRDLVSMVGNSSGSPKTSPRSKKASARSEGSSPRRAEKVYLDVGRLDQISEEKLSLKTSETSCPFYDMSVLPGSTLEDGDSLAK